MEGKRGGFWGEGASLFGSGGGPNARGPGGPRAKSLTALKPRGSEDETELLGDSASPEQKTTTLGDLQTVVWDQFMCKRPFGKVAANCGQCDRYNKYNSTKYSKEEFLSYCKKCDKGKRQWKKDKAPHCSKAQVEAMVKADQKRWDKADEITKGQQKQTSGEGTCDPSNPVGKCARCRASGGMLECDQFKGKRFAKPEECPDDLSKGTYWRMWTAGQASGKCDSFSESQPLTRSVVVASGKAKGGEDLPPPYNTRGRDIFTKPATAHPNMASLTVGAIGLKRMTCEEGEGGMNCATYKTGLCIDCKTTDFAFTHIQAPRNKPAELSEFAKLCVEKAFLPGGGLKASFVCSAADEKKFQQFLIAL
eukprot:TRINITY_DN549_c0_g6_i1.p1 TRINITY_DN549_c0_g6~~TRINITY_DN549_c0_g6_i1.p1  ORF type:complete len:364 (-),score=54.01 TRINITY_DN549_c0_g6_i1:152-1243(-)